MERIDIKTGFDCNNKCLFCVQGDKRYEYGSKSTEEVKEQLEENRQHADALVFTGGEVTIRKDFFELVRFAKELDYRVIQIQTNGRAFANMEFVERTMEAGATEFSPAIHGHTPELHDYLVHAPGAFRQTVKGVQNLKKMGGIIILNSVITRPNFRHLPQMARLFVALRIDQFQFAFIHAVGSGEKNFKQMTPRKSLVEPYVKQGLAIGIKGGCRVMTEAIPYCFMKGFEAYVAERIIPRTRIVDADWVVEDYTEFRETEGKLKGPPCAECTWNKVCEGPWREYPEAFGWDEFEPRKDPPPNV